MKRKNKSKKKAFDKFSIFWKAYLFLFGFIYVLGFIAVLSKLNMLYVIDLIVSLPSLAALYGLGFKKKLFANFYWKPYFYFFVAWHFILNYWLLSNNLISLDGLATTLAIAVVYIGLYIYAFKFLTR